VAAFTLRLRQRYSFPVIAGHLAIFATFISFAAAVFILQGAEPELSIDHVAYFRLVDDVKRAHPDGTYWKGINSLVLYGVILAFLEPITGSHIISLKWILATVTVLHLYAFYLLMTLLTDRRWQAALFSILAAFFVTFGASIWGVTDFSTSLQRSLATPIIILTVWFFIRYDARPIKFIVIPLLVASSIIHLSTLYVVAVLAILELGHWAVLRRCRLDIQLLALAGAIVLAYFVREGMEQLFPGPTRYVEASLKLATQYPLFGSLLSPADAWDAEVFAFPWRNMPLPLPTIAIIILSFGSILGLAAASAFLRWRHGFDRMDKIMLILAGSILIFSYGLQTVLWVGRQFLPIYPLNFEEVRAINLIMIPAIYFVFQIFRVALIQHRVNSIILCTGIVVMFLAQPIIILRTLPKIVKEEILTAALRLNLIRSDDSLRLLYAKQVLGLTNGDRRFFYSARGVIEWLSANAPRGTKVITDLNEMILLNGLDIQAIGPFNTVVSIGVTDLNRARWKNTVQDVSQALLKRDLKQIELIASKHGATLAVVPWDQPGALYQDKYYSIVHLGS